MMKIARAVEQKWRKAAFEFAIKFLDQTRWRRKSKLWSPFMSIDDRQTQWLIAPRVIEMEVQSAAQKIGWDGRERNRVLFARAKRRFFRLHAASASCNRVSQAREKSIILESGLLPLADCMHALLKCCAKLTIAP